jgi:glutamyl-tRNA synthetase
VPHDLGWLEKVTATLKDRAKTLVELVEQAHYYLSDDISIDEKAAKKFLVPEIKKPLNSLIQKLSDLTEFSDGAVQQVFAEVLEQTGLSMGKLAQPVRVALTGSTVSPGIHEVIAVLGKERTLKRLNAVMQRLVTPSQ